MTLFCHLFGKRHSRFLRGSVMAVLLASGGPVWADGEYVQLDYAPAASSAVASIQRDRFGLSLGWSEWDTGDALTFFVNYSMPAPLLGQGTALKFGPSYRREQNGHEDVGFRLAVEKYQQTDWGGFFLLADFNTIKQEYLFLVETGFGLGNLNIAISTQGDAYGYNENTVVVSRQIDESPLRFRFGYKFEEETFFVGVSLNTF